MVATRSETATEAPSKRSGATEAPASPPSKKYRKTEKEQKEVDDVMRDTAADDNVQKKSNGSHEESSQQENLKQETKLEGSSAKETTNGSMKSESKSDVPSSVLEKGIIYFFFRGKVGTEDPQGPGEVARSFIVLRPLPPDSKIGEGPLDESGKARLIALPKKRLPQSSRDRFAAFVEKADATVKVLKETFLPGKEYTTKTKGERSVPPVSPAAEGIYFITSTGRNSHLAYHITAPDHVGDVQNDLGIKQFGGFVITVKNPTTDNSSGQNAPSNNADYPEDVANMFRDLRWAPLRPEMIDYNNAQFLLIGEKHGPESALEDEGNEKLTDSPEQEFEKLEEEDEQRVENLAEDDPIFADLKLSSKEYSKISTEW